MREENNEGNHCGPKYRDAAQKMQYKRNYALFNLPFCKALLFLKIK